MPGLISPQNASLPRIGGTPVTPLVPGVTGAGGNNPVATSTTSSTSSEFPVLPTGPYPDRKLPSWLPATADPTMGELSDQYGKVGAAFDTGQVDAAAANQQAQDLSTGLQAANSAASEYSAKVMQQGGSGAASGLIRAEGIVGAQDAAGKAKVEAAKYDVQQREAAATQSAQIASTMADLRGNYLKSLMGYAATEDAAATGKTAESKGSASGPADGSGSGSGGGKGQSWATTVGGGLGGGNDPHAYNAVAGTVSNPSQSGAGVPWSPNNYGGGG